MNNIEFDVPQSRETLRSGGFKNPPPPAKQHINFEKYLNFKKLSFPEQEAYRIEAQTNFRNGAGSNSFLTDITFENKLIKRSNNGEGISPTFKDTNLAFQPAPPDNILGNGINISGLTESMQDIIKKINKFGSEVKIPITGERNLTSVDFANAWRKMGINPKDGEKLLKKLKLTWHHLDDLDVDMNATLQLVRRDAHDPISHSGSVKQAKILFDIINTL
jgi:hypothetical protein